MVSIFKTLFSHQSHQFFVSVNCAYFLLVIRHVISQYNIKTIKIINSSIYCSAKDYNLDVINTWRICANFKMLNKLLTWLMTFWQHNAWMLFASCSKSKWELNFFLQNNNNVKHIVVFWELLCLLYYEIVSKIYLKLITAVPQIFYF